MVYTKKKLLEPVVQFDKTESELLDQTREYELRTRYRARRELMRGDRQSTQVVTAAVKKWVAGLDKNDPEYDRLRCEALWALQGQHAVDPILLGEVLKAKTPNARAAAMHLVSDEADYLPNAPQLLAAGVRDENPRVRLEAIRGLSFFPTLASAKAALTAARFADRSVDRVHARTYSRSARASLERCVRKRIAPCQQRESENIRRRIHRAARPRRR